MSTYYIGADVLTKHFFLKKVRFLLNTHNEFGIITIAMEMAGISRRTASRKPQRGKDIEPAGSNQI